ncbi:regulator of Ty1 Transposition [Coemansia sp. RSA 2599]|nr:regulator of Ty1 Transposition [Coemansia sp. RSA 2599]
MAGSISPPPRLHLSEAEQKMFVRPTDSLFGGVVYWINPAIEQSKRHQLSQLLEKGGARPATIRRHEHERRAGAEARQTLDAKLNGVLVRPLPQMVHHIARFHIAPRAANQQNQQNQSQQQDGVLGATHVISPDTHFGEYAACMRAGVRVVTAQWVERSAAFGCRYVERYFSASAHKIFSGMVVLATHMPVEDKEQLLASVMALGGQWRERMRADVTHVVMMRPAGPIHDFMQAHSRLGIRAILPHWFKESINLLRCVPQEPYLFPDPPVLQGRMHRHGSPALLPAASESPGGAYDLPKPRVPFLSGYSVAIGSQIREALSDGGVAQLAQRLAEAGARVCLAIDDWDAVDILLCQHRFGYEYSKASRLGKMVCTMVWLYHAMLSGKLTSPTLRLLHYPVPLSAVPGMDRVVASVSGYTGAARQYICTLLLAMGARYTPHLSHENTHLVTMQVSGRKYELAIRANIQVVNHLWVEQCYQRWRMLAVAHPNFTYFPMLPLLGTLVGETEISVGRLSSWVDVPRSNTIAEWSDMDVLSDGDLAEDRNGADNNGNGRAGGDADTDIGTDTDADTDVKSVSESCEENAESPSGNMATDAAEPTKDGDRQQDEHSQSAATRHTTRAAAMAASKSLSNMMHAANIFEVEMRRERHYKRRNASSTTNRTAPAAGESAAAGGLAAEEEQKQQQHQKRRRVEGHVRIMVTHTRLSPREEQQVAALGGEIVATATEATHLVCEYSFKRTLKMLLAITSGRIFIVNRDWLTDSLEQGQWITIDYVTSSSADKSYQIQDREAEEKLGFSMEQSKRLAHSRRLFEGVTVLFTPNISPNFETMRALVEAAGGRAVTELPDKRLATLLRANDHAMRNASVKKLDDVSVPLLIISSELDSQMWSSFHSAHLGYPVVFKTDMILNSLLQQRIHIFNEQDRLLR